MQGILRALQVACLSCALLIVSALTAGPVRAAIAWQLDPDAGRQSAIRAADDDGSNPRQIVPRAVGFALSPDGSEIAYEAAGRVWVRATAGGAAPARAVFKGAGIATTAWRPDGRALLVGIGRRLRVVGLDGRVRSLFAIGGRGAITGVAFAPGGARVAAALDFHGLGHHARLVVATPRGARRTEVPLPGTSALRPVFAPGGVVVEAGTLGPSFSQDTIWTPDGEDPSGTRLSAYLVSASATAQLLDAVPEGGWPERLLPDGRLVFAAAPDRPGCLFDLGTRQCSAAAVPGLQDVGADGTTALVLEGGSRWRTLSLLAAGATAPAPLAGAPADTVMRAEWRGSAR